MLRGKYAPGRYFGELEKRDIGLFLACSPKARPGGAAIDIALVIIASAALNR